MEMAKMVQLIQGEEEKKATPERRVACIQRIERIKGIESLLRSIGSLHLL